MSLRGYVKLMKGKSFLGVLRGIRNVTVHKVKQFLLFARPAVGWCVDETRTPSVVVSLTSFPPRIGEVSYCVKSILNQSIKPNAVLLWLATEQFPNGEKDLPKKLLKLQKHGLTIAWCSDIRSYKKIIPTLERYPDSVIITTDDDVYYPRHWLKGLLDAYEKEPGNVYCYRAARISYGDVFGREHPKKGICYPCATFLHQQTGVGGVLYPPGSLNADVTREDLFMTLAPTNDDLWLWFMNILNGYRIVILDDNDFELFYIGKSQKVSLTAINDHGEELYYKQLKNLFERYPVVRERLQQEQARIS